MELNKQTINGQTYEEIVKPLPVTIVRPTYTPIEGWAHVIRAVVSLFATSWILMLILGALHHQLDARIPAPGYWTTVLVFIASNIFFKGGDMFRWWTRTARAGEK